MRFQRLLIASDAVTNAGDHYFGQGDNGDAPMPFLNEQSGQFIAGGLVVKDHPVRRDMGVVAVDHDKGEILRLKLLIERLIRQVRRWIDDDAVDAILYDVVHIFDFLSTLMRANDLEL